MFIKNSLSSTKLHLRSGILISTFFISLVVKGDEQQGYIYNPSAELVTKLSRSRKIAEFNYMQPFFTKENHVPIFDLKLKLDNKRSKEVNLGLAYRYNCNDKAIFGTYAYFDHRHTGNFLSVNGLTAGIEVLSKYLDARANIYIPQNKRKKINHNSKKVVIAGTSIFALSGGHTYESSLRGYDIEVGTPIFSFSDSLNEKFGTKIYVARYSFTGKNVKSIKGTRFRLEQDIGETLLGDNRYKFHISAETQFDKVRKRQNSLGLGLKVIFNDKKNSHKKKANSLNHRMMETIIRDVDIVTERNVEPTVRNNFYINGKEIKNIYYVGSADVDYTGSGTKESPFSFEQLQNINYDDAVIIVTLIEESKGGKEITRQDYIQMQEIPQILNGKKDIVLSTNGADAFQVKIDGTQGILISSEGNKNTSVISLIEEKTANIVETQVEMARVEAQVEAAREQQSFYDIMMFASGLETDDNNNLYVIRQVQYDDVANIINTNPGADILRIETLIDRRNDLDIVTKERYKKTARLIIGFNGVAENGALDGGQQGIGTGHTGPKDITIVAALERLRADYGILDGQMAIDIAKRFVIKFMQTNIPNIGRNPATIALVHQDTVPTQRYQDAVNQYLNNSIVPLNENVNDRNARLQRKRDAKVIIDNETKSSLTAVNNYMAAYRALNRMETTPDGVFTEEVMGRYNDKEMLAYAILANLDVNEVQKNLLANNIPLTPENIFNRQKENIEGLVNRLGLSQRAYNVDHIHGAIDVGGVNNAIGGNRIVWDSPSCAHGLCVRIMDSALHHSKVVLSDASPASFADEFNQAVVYKANRLPLLQRQEINGWQNNIQGDVAVNYYGGQTSFETPIVEGGNQVDIPIFYKRVLSEIATEMDMRYNFTHINPKLQLVKQRDATNVFKYVHYIPVPVN